MTPKQAEWWCFDAYEVKDGFIRPVPGARLDGYDPWARYWKEGSAVHSPPYVELGELIRKLPDGERLPRPGDEPESLVKAVRAWCRRYGLLGLLPHDTRLASLDPWIVSRSAKGWEAWRFSWEPEEQPTEFLIETELDGGGWMGSVDDWWGYFPDLNKGEVMEDFRLVPLSEDFWKSYCEPLDRFLARARHLDHAVRAVSGEVVTDLDIYPREVLDAEKAMERLNGIAHGVTPVVGRDENGRFHQEWRSPSLLGHLAMQVVQDLIGGYIRRCHCGNSFSSRNPKRRHCSDRCGTLFRVRKHRTKSKK